MTVSKPDKTGPDPQLPQILVIGDLDRWKRLGRAVPDIDGYCFVDFADLTDGIARHGPDVVVSALFAGTFDAIEVARMLAKAGFGGRYRVLASGLPAKGMIVAEVRSVAPDLDFDVLDIAP